MMLAIGMLGSVELIFLPIALGVALFVLWMLIHCLISESPATTKIVWALFILLTQGLGAILYYFFRYAPRKRSAAA